LFSTKSRAFQKKKQEGNSFFEIVTSIFLFFPVIPGAYKKKKKKFLHVLYAG